MTMTLTRCNLRTVQRCTRDLPAKKKRGKKKDAPKIEKPMLLQLEISAFTFHWSSNCLSTSFCMPPLDGATHSIHTRTHMTYRRRENYEPWHCNIACSVSKVDVYTDMHEPDKAATSSRHALHLQAAAAMCKVSPGHGMAGSTDLSSVGRID